MMSDEETDVDMDKTKRSTDELILHGSASKDSYAQSKNKPADLVMFFLLL